MKSIHSFVGYTLVSLIGLLLVSSCETIINPELEQTASVVVVDAWLTSQPKAQNIKLTLTQTYFDNTLPPAISSATVSVSNETDGRVFNFIEDGTTGIYVWIPSSPTDSIGKTEDVFSLSVIVGQDSYYATSKLGRVPTIDSVTFKFEKGTGFFDDRYTASFWAQEPEGKGDTYWIKSYRNDSLKLKPTDINVAFDAGFSEGGDFDGVSFIPPIRQGISAPINNGDTVYVELLSINKQAFNFLFEVTLQTDRPGGFSELFTSPIANVSTNIFNVIPNGKRAVGFFNVGSLSSAGKKLVK